MTAVSEQDGQSILVERPTDYVMHLILNRPAKLNALTFDMFDQLAVLSRKIESDDEIRCVVISGAGKGFCSGLDLECAEALGAMTAEEMFKGQANWADAISAFHRLSKPVIAAIDGATAGAGLGLALSADIRYASENARFTTAFVRIGLSGGDVGVSWLLPRIVGLGAAAELLMTSRTIDAAEALRLGLVTRIHEPADLIDEVLAVASEVASHRPLAITLTKQALRASLATGSLELALELENRNQVIAATDNGMQDGLKALLKRK